MSIAFTVGHTVSYDQALTEKPRAMKIGRRPQHEDEPEYPGGWVWRSPQEAADYLKSQAWDEVDWGDGKPRNRGNFSVYEIDLPSGWDQDVWGPSAEDGLMHLINDAQILRKC